MKTNKLHYNYPQIRSQIVGAPEEWMVAGRGTGKSEGVLATKSTSCYLHTMPRGCGVIVGATFTQILTRTLPALVAGWEKLGYKENVHFIIGRKPPDKWIKQWGWIGPYRKPQKIWDYFISWWNNAGCHLVSQDRVGTSNGITIDWIIGDEAKLLNREKLVRELFPANRGLIKDFEGNPYHHGKTFTTDMPVGSSGRWILQKEDEMDKKVLNEILSIQSAVFQLKAHLGRGKTTANNARRHQINVLENELRIIRKNFLYYHEASTLDNIHALGVDYIKEQLRDSSPFEFDTQILNKRPLKLEEGFYPDLDEEKHGYFSYNYSHIDNYGYQLSEEHLSDCRKDNDIDTELPFHISLDYNRRIFPMVIAQDRTQEIRIVKGLHVLYPLKVKDLIDRFCDYYRYHKKKLVYYWYDHTAIAEQDYTPISNDVVNYLSQKGWTVVRMYIGLKLSHEATYRMFGDMLRETNKYPKKLRVNRDNCKHLFLSMYQAGAEQRNNGFGKDKATEKDPNFPAEESTHYSEALDVLIQGLVESNLRIYESRETQNPITIL
jgi:hypothetical protein